MVLKQKVIQSQRIKIGGLLNSPEERNPVRVMRKDFEVPVTSGQLLVVNC